MCHALISQSDLWFNDNASAYHAEGCGFDSLATSNYCSRSLISRELWQRFPVAKLISGSDKKTNQVLNISPITVIVDMWVNEL